MIFPVTYFFLILKLLSWIFLNFILFIYFLYSRFLLVIYFIRISVYMSIPISQFIPPPPPSLSPLGVHTFVLYICVYFCLANWFISTIFLNSKYKHIQYLFFLFWLTSLCMTISRSIHISGNGTISCGWVILHCIYIYCIFFIHSSVDGHLGCFCVLTIVNSAAMNIRVHASFRILFFSGYMPRSGIAGS